jgi:SCY1-like protein 2
MGNGISANFDIDPHPTATGGPSHLWKIHSGKRKTNGQPCSVFLYDKKYLEVLNPLSNSTSLRRDQERVHEILKKEAMALVKLRHPCLLEIGEAPDDSNSALAFATEPVIASLSNLLKMDHLGTSKNIRAFEYELDEIEVNLIDLAISFNVFSKIQKGIIQIVKGLEFLHANNWIHCCLSPESIYINSKGDWKISGFNFSTTTTSSSIYISDFPPFCSPSIDYLAPEIVQSSKSEISSDTWSLGCLIYSLFYNGNSLFKSNNNIQNYNSKINQMHSINFENLPISLRGILSFYLLN